MRTRGFLDRLAWACPLLLLLAAPLRLSAAISYDNDLIVWSNTTAGGSTSSSGSTVPGNSNQILFVVLSCENSLNSTTVTWAGTGMTKSYSFSGSGLYNYVYTLTSPLSGSRSIVVTTSNGQTIGVSSFSFTGVNISSPFGTNASNSSTSTSDKVTFTPQYSTSTFVVFGDAASSNSNPCSSYTVSTGSVLKQTSASYPLSNYSHNYGLSDDSPGSTASTSDTESWTCTSTYSSSSKLKEQLGWVVELNPAGNTSPTPVESPTVTPTVSTTPTQTPLHGGASDTPTFSPTPTSTYTPLTPVYSGLPANMRPYGLEYVPFPTVTSSSNMFYPLYMTYTTASSSINGPGNALSNTQWGAPCNTARWHIVFQGLSTTVGGDPRSFKSMTVTVETRIGMYGISCTSGVYDQYAYSNATSLTLPWRPQNYSSTYFWVGTTYTAVPYTERFDAVGDPRFVPYADELDYSGAIDDGLQGGYNWFWRNFADTSTTYADGAQDAYYQPFLPSAKFDHYASSTSGTDQGQNIDIPKLFGLIREGVLLSNAIYTAMTGWDSYYAGQGGEIGGDQSNDFDYGVACYGGPWGNTNNTWHVDEIIGTSEYPTVNVDGAAYVVSGTSTSNITWTSLPFVGELWPDSQYVAQWEGNWSGNNNGNNATWGNLNNLEQGGSFFRVPMQNDITVTASDFLETLHHQEGIGCATLENGTNDGSTPFNHTSVSPDISATLLNDGTQMSTEYNFSLPSTFNVSRPWGLAMGGNTPPEWSMSPYSARRTHLDVYSATTYTSDVNWGYYADNNQSATSVTYKSAAAIRSIDLSEALSSQSVSGNPAGGWLIVNGLDPSTQSGINFVAQFAILACLRTFQDAGVPTQAASVTAPNFTNGNNTYSGAGTASGNTYRIPPVPLVTILHPTSSDPVAGLSTITIDWDERYARWDGNQYDENYPCLDANEGPCSSADVIANPALEWHDPQPIAFNVIYNMPQGVSPTAWYSALTGDEVTAGAANNYVDGGSGNYMASSGNGNDAILPGSSYETSPYQYSLAWTNVAPALYNVQVECFRLKSSTSTTCYPHYSYHQIQINTVP